MKVHIEVTQEHIDNGVEADACKCPIALAAQTLFPGKPISVWRDLSVRTSDRERLTGELPAEAREFVHTFDMEGKKAVAPFAFDVDLDETVDR